MEKITIDDKDRPATMVFEDFTNGTSSASIYLNVSLEELIRKVGLPSLIGSGGNKTQLEWVFVDHVFDEIEREESVEEDEDTGQTITIYDWKEHCPIYEINNWHVGSKNMSQQEVISELKVLGFDEEEIKKD